MPVLTLSVDTCRFLVVHASGAVPDAVGGRRAVNEVPDVVGGRGAVATDVMEGEGTTNTAEDGLIVRHGAGEVTDMAVGLLVGLEEVNMAVTCAVGTIIATGSEQAVEVWEATLTGKSPDLSVAESMD